MASIQVLDATPEDAHVIAEIESLAFSSDRASQIMFGPSSPDGISARAADIKFAMVKDPSTRFFKAIFVEQGKETPVVAGVAQWFVRSAQWNIVKVPELENTQSGVDVPSTWGPHANDGACNAFFGWVYEVRKRRMGGKEHGVLNLLAVRPEYQGCGVGSALLKHGLNLPELQGRPLWLEASAAGYRLYENRGFEDVEEHITDYTPFGSEWKETHVGMLRQPSISANATSNQHG